ncbi:MAG: malto-oligosyltrehalose trehalohydrolase [Pirellulaceae bacterium]
MQWRVWAPSARQVELVLSGEGEQRRQRLTPEENGHFIHVAGAAREGQRYAYSLDGGPARPDPCSLWQPDGVHRPSALVFPERFAWTDQNWQGIAREHLVFYELHVGTFTREGTFDAVIPRLAELRELGITALEIMPVAQFPGTRNWGYDGVNLFAPQNSYGGPHGLARLVDAAHAAGLAVFLDVVFNHFGPEGNYIGEFGPYYSDRYRTPWGPAFNFDGRESDPVRDFVLDNVWHWLHDYHLDGLRLDAVHAMFDISPRHILREIKEVADLAAGRHGRQACIVVESLLNDVRMVQPVERGGYGLDAEWNEDFHHAVIAFLTGERHGKYIDFGSPEQLPRVLEQTFLLSGTFSRYRGRRWGGSAGDLPGDRFVVGVQNHDHIGNRALGERLATLTTPPVQRLAASLMLMAPHLPLLFMGEEYGEQNPFLFFCSFGDSQLIESVRTGRCRDYTLVGEIPDPQDEASFTASRLTWSWPAGSPQAGLRQLYRDLLTARREWPALADWSQRSARLLPDAVTGPLLELVRGGRQPEAEQTLTIYFNLCGERQPLPDRAPLNDVPLFRSEHLRYCGTSESEHLAPAELAPYECVVFGPASWRKWV